MSWADRLEFVSEWTGRVIAWLMLPMVIGTFIIVVLRYVFDLGWIWMQESVMWLHAAVFMLAAAYTLRRDEHVRVDIFYRGLAARGKALVNVLGTLLLLMPMMIFLLWSSYAYVRRSWINHEASPEAGGLPYPFVPLLKSLIVVAAALLVVQGVAVVLREGSRLFGSSNTGADKTA